MSEYWLRQYLEDVYGDSATYPGEQGLPLSHVVDELEGSGGAVDAAVHIPVEVQQSHLLLFTAVRGLHLWATHSNTLHSQS